MPKKRKILNLLKRSAKEGHGASAHLLEKQWSANVEYLPDRGVEQGEVLRFGTCNYIQEHHNIILLGATGSGKTHLACALGMAAERRFFAVKYIRCPDLLVEFQIATDLLEIVESRYKRNSTIFCSQFDIPGWRSKLSNLLLEDTICDRIVHDA